MKLKTDRSLSARKLSSKNVSTMKSAKRGENTERFTRREPAVSKKNGHFRTARVFITRHES